MPGGFPVGHSQPGLLSGRQPVSTWLFRIAANKARDYRERQRAAKRGGGQVPLSLQAEDPESGLTIDPPGTAPAPDLALLNAEQAALVHQALDQLDEPCREVIQLRYFGDLSYDENQPLPRAQREDGQLAPEQVPGPAGRDSAGDICAGEGCGPSV